MFRVIDATTMELKEFDTCENVEYVILSHRWETDDEIGHQQFLSHDFYRFSRTTRTTQLVPKRGFVKIQQCCKVALDNGICYVWIDTCCIDKKSSAELQEAINSMYQWYHQAYECYAYLYDAETTQDLAQSVWFTRGWTLQELIVCNSPNH